MPRRARLPGDGRGRRSHGVMEDQAQVEAKE